MMAIAWNSAWWALLTALWRSSGLGLPACLEQAPFGGYQRVRINHRFSWSCSRSGVYVTTVDTVMSASARGPSVRVCSVTMSLGFSSGSSAR